MFYALIGIPRSGTSIISRAFNGFENGWCLDEPHHALGLSRINKTGVPEIGISPGVHADAIITHAHAAQKLSGKSICGIKEVDTCRGGDRWRAITNDAHLFDRLFFVERDPFDLWSAWKRSEFGRRGIDEFCKTVLAFRRLRDYHISNRTAYILGRGPYAPEVVAFHYEAFSENPADYMGRTVGSYRGKFDIGEPLKVRGPIDGAAQRARLVRQHKRSELTSGEIAILQKNL